MMIKAIKALQRKHHHRPRKAKYEMDMTTGPLLPKVLSFSLPLPDDMKNLLLPR